MQAWDLSRKILVTQTRIIEWYQRYNGRVYVSFSGGKDSTVLLHIARQIYPDIKAMYIDTGLEYPEIRAFVKTHQNVDWTHPIRFDHATYSYVRTNFKEVLMTYGYPLISKEQAKFIREYRETFSEIVRNIRWYGNKWGRGKISECHKYLIESDIKISEKCCDVMKKNPAKLYEKENGVHPILTTMADESELRATRWMQNGCNAFDAKRPLSAPMSFWTEQDVLRYLHENNIPYASVYGEILCDNFGVYHTTKCQRTGCVFCGFGAHLEKVPNRFQRLKHTHPKLWDYCMKPIDHGGLGMAHALDVINVKYE